MLEVWGLGFQTLPKITPQFQMLLLVIVKSFNLSIYYVLKHLLLHYFQTISFFYGAFLQMSPPFLQPTPFSIIWDGV